MQTTNSHSWAVSAMCWIVAVVFLYAAVSKLVALPQVSWNEHGLSWKLPQGSWLLPAREFQKAIANYRILPFAACGPLAVTLPWIEMAAAFALLTRRFRYEGALIIGGLLVVFFVAISYALWNGFDITCGCFPLRAGAKRIGWENLLFDGMLLSLVAGIMASLEQERRSVQ